MKKNYFILLLHIAFVNVSGQNLIPNPGFETVSPCPTGISQIPYTSPWNLGSSDNYGTPEAYNNGGACSFMPSDNGQGVATANSGNGLAGLFCYRTVALNREYLITNLSSPLVAGTDYTLTFYVRKSSQSRYSIDEIGAYFSTAAPPCTNVSAPCNATSTLMPVTPQVKTPVGAFPTNTWQQVTLTITATAAWQYITIGNFDTDAATGKFDNGSGSNYAYLLFDDFALSVTSVLPIKTNYFQMNCISDKNKLTWEFATPDFGQIALESSMDGIYFRVDKMYVANGQTKFEYYDEFNEKKYYRLKQTDNNGNVEYSNILTANNCTGQVSSVRIFPNPTSDFIKIENAAEGSLIEVYDVLGRNMINVSTTGEDIEVIDVSSFASRMYLVVITYKGELKCKTKIVKNNSLSDFNK